MPRSFVLGDQFEAFTDAQVVLRSRADELRILVGEGLVSGLSTNDGADFLGRLKTKYAAKPPQA